MFYLSQNFGKTRIFRFSKIIVKSSWKYVDVLSHATDADLKVSYIFLIVQNSCRSLNFYVQKLDILSDSKLFDLYIIVEILKGGVKFHSTCHLNYCSTSF